jgi:hypothetical protein
LASSLPSARGKERATPCDLISGMFKVYFCFFYWPLRAWLAKYVMALVWTPENAMPSYRHVVFKSCVGAFKVFRVSNLFFLLILQMVVHFLGAKVHGLMY